MQKRFRMLLASLGFTAKPGFLIIGAQKAGTTALFYILNQHSLLKGAAIKEVHYFDNDNWYEEGKIRHYHSFFPMSYQIPKNCKTFEATPIYLYHPHVAERLFDYNPRLKLIAVLRNPALRALSSWIMYHHHFKEGKNQRLHDPRPFEEAVREEIRFIGSDDYYSNHRGYVQRGIYHRQLETYYKYFDQDRILILESNELWHNFDTALSKILTFLEVPEEELKLKLLNRSRVDGPENHIEALSLLREFYRPYNLKLFNLINTGFDWDN